MTFLRPDFDKTRVPIFLGPINRHEEALALKYSLEGNANSESPSIGSDGKEEEEEASHSLSVVAAERAVEMSPAKLIPASAAIPSLQASPCSSKPSRKPINEKRPQLQSPMPRPRDLEYRNGYVEEEKDLMDFSQQDLIDWNHGCYDLMEFSANNSTTTTLAPATIDIQHKSELRRTADISPSRGTPAVAFAPYSLITRLDCSFPPPYPPPMPPPQPSSQMATDISFSSSTPRNTAACSTSTPHSVALEEEVRTLMQDLSSSQSLCVRGGKQGPQAKGGHEPQSFKKSDDKSCKGDSRAMVSSREVAEVTDPLPRMNSEATPRPAARPLKDKEVVSEWSRVRVAEKETDGEDEDLPFTQRKAVLQRWPHSSKRAAAPFLLPSSAPENEIRYYGTQRVVITKCGGTAAIGQVDA